MAPFADIAALRGFLLACTLVHYALLTAWFCAFVFAHDALYRLHGRWFRLTREQFDAIHYGGMALYKILVLMFGLVPWCVLAFVAR